MKQPITVSLSAEQKRQIDAACAEVEKRTGFRPSRAEVMRTAIDRGLPLLLASAGNVAA